MEKFTKYIKENYKLMIPVILMVVLFLAFIIYYKVSISNNYTEVNKGNFYQYFYDKKYEYEGVVTTNKRGEVVDFKSISLEVNFDSTPIYYQNKEKVIFPKDMSVVMPTLSCAEYLSSGYSIITLKDGVYNLITNKYNNKLNHYFLYDGKDLYFFIENVKLKYNNEEVTLSAFSYVIVKSGKYVAYYDKKNDVYKTIELSNNEVIVSNDYYTVNLASDMIDYQGTNVVLTSGIENLNTIDMKD